MASNTPTKTAAKRNRSHSRKTPIAAGSQPGDNAQQERRFLSWLYSNATAIQAAIISSANRAGENRQYVDMQQELALASEFGRLCNFRQQGSMGQQQPQRQQPQSVGGSTSNEPARAMGAAAGG